MSNRVEVVPYDPHWPALFESEAKKIQAILGDNCITIHHVGSTSIPGLAAKPIIDMIPVVKDILAVDSKITAMQARHYESKGEHGMAFRRFFQKNEPGQRYNVHVFEENNSEILRNILFRDYLIQHNHEKQVYAALKKQLAKTYPNDILSYIAGKDDYIRDIIEAKAGFKGYRLLQALMPREWEAYHRIRRIELFEMIGMVYDPNHWTLSAKNHRHFVFVKGSEIIGVAQIELFDEYAILRPMAIDEAYQNQGNGTLLLKLIEKWILHQGKRVVCLHARNEIVPFYKKAGYSEMDFDDPDKIRDSIDLGKILK